MAVNTGNCKIAGCVKIGNGANSIVPFKKLSQCCHPEPICIFADIPSTDSRQFSFYPERSKGPTLVLEHREGITNCRVRISNWSLSAKARNTEFVFSESLGKMT
jgi:hypothetical protein